ncbi:MAG: lasso RiPP family leader peptide-containing protein [Erythrobacter sp.]
MAQPIATAQSKAQYAKPRLAVYGEFANLTAGGTGSIVEGMMMTALMRRP